MHCFWRFKGFPSGYTKWIAYCCADKNCNDTSFANKQKIPHKKKTEENEPQKKKVYGITREPDVGNNDANSIK